jgi:pimeloyl-ACP methyl ester carboxylesterase
MSNRNGPPLDSGAFPVERATVADGLELAFIRRGEGGYPLLLVHGWPETRRIWWRNVEPLAGAGFEVIVPDLRGFGDSDLAPDGFYDPAANATDLYRLVHDVLGHERCAAAGGDFGGVAIQDLGLRFEGFVERQCLFNTVLPLLPDDYERAGLEPRISRETRVAADYFIRQGREADELAAELDTPERRRRYIGQFYGSRFWAAPGTFDRDSIDFMTEPFGDADKLRAGFGIYETVTGNRPFSEPPRMLEKNPLTTLVLYGPEDHVVPADFPERCAVAFPEIVGPFDVRGAGHFLQWERADVLNRALIYFFADLRERA